MLDALYWPGWAEFPEGWTGGVVMYTTGAGLGSAGHWFVKCMSLKQTLHRSTALALPVKASLYKRLLGTDQSRAVFLYDIGGHTRPRWTPQVLGGLHYRGLIGEELGCLFQEAST